MTWMQKISSVKTMNWLHSRYCKELAFSLCHQTAIAAIAREGTDAAKDPLGSGKRSLAGFKYLNNAT